MTTEKPTEVSGPPIKAYHKGPQAILPAFLAGLARATDGLGRHTGFVHLELLDGQYIAQATNGRMAVRVSGPLGATKDFPVVPALEVATNGEYEATVSAIAWRKLWKTLGKQPAGAGVIIGPTDVTMAGPEGGVGVAANAGARRFPDLHAIPPKCHGQRVHFNVSLLQDFLAIASAVVKGEVDQEVEIEVWGPQSPVVLRCTSADGLHTLYGLIMPVDASKKKGSAK